MENGHNGNGITPVPTDIITLTRFLTEQQSKLGSYATGDFTFVAPPS
jgi:hypothetical protein